MLLVLIAPLIKLFKKNKIGVTEYLAKKCNIKNNKGYADLE